MKRYSRKQKGGNCGNYALLSDVFPQHQAVVQEVKDIMDSSLEGTPAMNEAEAAKTTKVVVGTVKEIVPGISPGKIQDVVRSSISKNNVQMGGKRLKRKSTTRSKTKSKSKSKSKSRTKPKKK